MTEQIAVTETRPTIPELPITPGSQYILPSGTHLMLHNDGLWHDTSGRGYEAAQLPEGGWAYDAGGAPA